MGETASAGTGQLQPKARSALHGDELERSAVRLGNGARDGESKAGPRAASRGIPADEAFEEDGLECRRDSRSVVGDVDLRAPFGRAERDLDGVAAVSQSVVEEVLNGAAEEQAIAEDAA